MSAIRIGRHFVLVGVGFIAGVLVGFAGVIELVRQ